jgi:two-component system, NtrC family, nitrogen regulation response regulator GlnG
MGHLLVIDDDPFTRACFLSLFAKEEGTVATAETAADGLRRFADQRPDAIVLDIRLPDRSGLELFEQLHELDPSVPVILITGRGTVETAIEAMRLGAYDYIVKPLEAARLRELIESVFETSRLMQVPAKVADAELENEPGFLLLGKCLEMQQVYKAIGRVASCNLTVLILGESGTGKELVARALYHYSDRANRPFLAINCAAIPETLLESELFGHEKGAFTGADRKRIGKFEQCNGGTLFLDEIGDMTPLTQTKILRVLQDGQFERVGGNETIKADVRVIAATNRDLGKLIAQGRFRQDLYYRLNVYTIHLPPLRERLGDLPLLARHFVRKFSCELGKDVEGITREALELLQRYTWPGNVRELQSVLKQAILQATGPALVPACLPPVLQAKPNDRASTSPSEAPDLLHHLTRFVEDRIHAGSNKLYYQVLTLVERHLFLQVLRHTGGNQSRAAQMLKLSRKTLRTKMNSFGIAVEHQATLQEEEEMPRLVPQLA